jgi:recombination protein RecT
VGGGYDKGENEMSNEMIKADVGVLQKAKPTNPTAYIHAILTKKSAEIKKALPAVMTHERFTRIALTAISANPTLAQAAVTSPMTFVGSVMTAAQLGLEPNTPLGHCYLIPRKRKGVWEVQFQLGYKGLIDLAYRSGEVSLVQAHCVYENDTFEYELGLEPKLRHVPTTGERGAMIYAYAIFKTKNGATGFSCMSKHDLDSHRDQFSDAAKSDYSPWTTHYEEMAKKTVLKDALRYAPLKSDFVRQASLDNAVKADIDADMSSVADVVDAETPPRKRTSAAALIEDNEAPSEVDANVKAAVLPDLA